MHTLQILPCHVSEREVGVGGEENVVTEDHKGILITENYKNIHNGHSI
jgi:hypothetical protein